MKDYYVFSLFWFSIPTLLTFSYVCFMLSHNLNINSFVLLVDLGIYLASFFGWLEIRKNFIKTA